ncbi:hypothetical protein ACEXQD_04370 [Herbiconiux sp. P15]|uniref:hypothetical protein n=1 Tax=Herbiconiux liukaitaii TaxID=3342799 RepID=UPI0035BB3A0A
MTALDPTTRLPVGGVDLIYAGTQGIVEGRLHTQPGAKGLVIIAYPTAYSRFGRNDEVLCAIAHERGYSTLSVDLLTPEEMTGRTEELSGRLLQRLLAVLEDSDRRGQNGLCVFAIGEAAPAAIAAADVHEVIATVTCRVPGTVGQGGVDLDHVASNVWESTPAPGTPMTWADADQAMRRALVRFDVELARRSVVIS